MSPLLDAEVDQAEGERADGVADLGEAARRPTPPLPSLNMTAGAWPNLSTARGSRSARVSLPVVVPPSGGGRGLHRLSSRRSGRVARPRSRPRRIGVTRSQSRYGRGASRAAWRGWQLAACFCGSAICAARSRRGSCRCAREGSGSPSARTWRSPPAAASDLRRQARWGQVIRQGFLLVVWDPPPHLYRLCGTCQERDDVEISAKSGRCGTTRRAAAAARRLAGEAPPNTMGP